MGAVESSRFPENRVTDLVIVTGQVRFMYAGGGSAIGINQGAVAGDIPHGPLLIASLDGWFGGLGSFGAARGEGQ